MRYCIIDDEPIAHRIIEGYCQKLPHFQKGGNCYDAFEAIQLLSKQSIDLIFLDINMPGLSGFELLKTLHYSPIVIVTSAHQEYALEGYELNISDYPLKPFSFGRFLQAINKVIDHPATVAPNQQQTKSSRFFIKGDKKIHQIHADKILFIEAAGNYTKIILPEENVVTHQRISALEKMLPASDFIRVHKSFIVALDRINVIEGNRIVIGEHSIPIGQTYKNNLKRLFEGG